MTKTGTQTHTMDHPITTSAPLVWYEVGALRFLRRPVRYAAPFRPVPVAPSLVFQVRGAAAVSEQTYRAPLGLHCYMFISSVSARSSSGDSWSELPLTQGRRSVFISGPLTVLMTQSVCVFPEVVFGVRSEGESAKLTSEFLVQVTFCANTSRMTDPRVPLHPCNASQFHVAQCPARPSPIAEITTNPSPLYSAHVFGPPTGDSWSIFTSNKSGSGRLVVDVSGSSFYYSMRNRYSCQLTTSSALGNSTTVVAAAAAWLADMCRLRCVFSGAALEAALTSPLTQSTSVFFSDGAALSSTNATMLQRSALFGLVEVTLDSQAPRSASACGLLTPASEALLSSNSPAARPSRGCSDQHYERSVFLSPCALRVVGAVEPHRFVSTHLEAVMLNGRGDGSSVVKQLTIAVCDAAGNPVPSWLGPSQVQLLLPVSLSSPSNAPSTTLVTLALPHINETFWGNATRTGRDVVLWSRAEDGGMLASLHNISLASPPFGASLGNRTECINAPAQWPTGASSWMSVVAPAPSSLFGAVDAAQRGICIRVTMGFVSRFTFLNVAAIARIADTATAMYVSPVIGAVDVLGNKLPSAASSTFAGSEVTLDNVLVNMTVSLVQLPQDNATINASALRTVVLSSGQVVTVEPDEFELYRFPMISTLPVTLSGIVFPRPGRNFSVMINCTQFTHKGSTLLVRRSSATVLFWDDFDIDMSASVTVTSCPAAPLDSGVPVFGVTRVEMRVGDGGQCSASSQLGLLNHTGTTTLFNNTMLVGGSSVVVHGHGFRYGERNGGLMCHVSNWRQLFPMAALSMASVVPPGAVNATFVSSCRVACSVPSQPFPIGPTGSLLAYNRDGVLVPSSTLARLSAVGQLRLRGAPGVWSTPPLPLQVVGAASQMRVVDWPSRLQNRVQVTVPTFTVVLMDAVGNDLVHLDAAGQRSILLYYTPQKSGQLNGTSSVSVTAYTCDPVSGTAVFAPFLIYPSSGDYVLTLSAAGIASHSLLLNIFDNITVSHDMLLLSPFPLCFVLVTLDRSSTDNGRFPITPQVGVFLKNSSRVAVDNAVSDVRIIASIVRDPDFPVPPVDPNFLELGVGLEDCNSDYGNCEFLDGGLAALPSLRFTGIPGMRYVVTIRAYNESLDMSNVSFRVTVPFCPVNSTLGNLTAALVQYNSSLRSRSGGSEVKGWRFPIPTSLSAANTLSNLMFSCFIGDSVYLPNATSWSMPSAAASVAVGSPLCTLGSDKYPGVFVDVCTVRCFADDGVSTDASWSQGSTAICTTDRLNETSHNCCFNRTRNGVDCRRPVTEAVSVHLYNTSSASVGTYTFIGSVNSMVVLPNVESRRTIFGNEQIVVAAATTPLDAIIVSLVDELGNPLGRTAPEDVDVWIDGFLHAADWSVSRLTVPGTSTRDLRTSLVQLREAASRAAASRRASLNATVFDNITGIGLCLTPSFERLPLLSNGTFVNNVTVNETAAVGTPPSELGALDPALLALFDTAFEEHAVNNASGGPPPRAYRWQLSNGVVSLTNLSLVRPPVGVYHMPIFVFVRSAGQYFTTNATVYVTPGRPVALCLAAVYDAVSIPNNELLDPQPKVYLVDVAGNVYQSMRSNQVVVSSDQYAYLRVFDVLATNANVTCVYEQYNASTATWEPTNMTLSAPAAEYNSFDAVQYSFNGVKLNAVHGLAYQLVFLSDRLESNVGSPAMSIRPCNTIQHAIPLSADCLQCPSGLGEHCIGGYTTNCFECNGSTAMNVTQNYWRFAPHSEYAYSCPASSCIGGTELGACAEGYESVNNPLCGACKAGYAKDFLGDCVPCAATWVTVLVVVIILLIAAIVIFVFIYLSVKGALSDDENDNHVVMMLKIFMNYTQVAGMLGDFKVNFTGYVLAYFNFVNAATGGSGVSISPVNCLFPDLTFLDKMSAQLVTPGIVLVLVAACLGIMHVRRIRKEKRLAREATRSLATLQQVLVVPVKDDCSAEANTDMDQFSPSETQPDNYQRRADDDEREQLMSSIDAAVASQPIVYVPRKKLRNHVPFRQVFGNASMILIFVQYQGIVTQCIATFNCRSLRTGRTGDATAITILDADVRVTCSGSDYETGLSVAIYGVFLYAVFLPLFTMLFVLNQARQLGWAETYKQFSFLIKGFRLKYWYWEFVVVFRKVGLRLLIAMVNDARLQALLGIWFLTALFVLQTYAKPYVLPIHNHADQLCLMSALVTLNIALAFSTYSNGCGVVCGIFSIILIITNVSVIAFLVAQLGWGAYLRIVEEFGIDAPGGLRWISVRNLKNIALTILQRQDKMYPSFKTYTPRHLNSAIAESVLGDAYDATQGIDGKVVDGEKSDEADSTYQPPLIVDVRDNSLRREKNAEDNDAVEMTVFEESTEVSQSHAAVSVAPETKARNLSVPRQDLTFAQQQDQPPSRRSRRSSSKLPAELQPRFVQHADPLQLFSGDSPGRKVAEL